MFVVVRLLGVSTYLLMPYFEHVWCGDSVFTNALHTKKSIQIPYIHTILLQGQWVHRCSIKAKDTLNGNHLKIDLPMVTIAMTPVALKQTRASSPARSPPSLSSAWLAGRYSCKWCSSDQSLRLQLTASPIFAGQKDIENNHSWRHERCWFASKKYVHFSWGIHCCLWYFQRPCYIAIHFNQLATRILQLLRLSETSTTCFYKIGNSWNKRNFPT